MDVVDYDYCRDYLELCLVLRRILFTSCNGQWNRIKHKFLLFYFDKCRRELLAKKSKSMNITSKKHPKVINSVILR